MTGAPQLHFAGCGLIGGLTLLQHLTGIHLGMDELLFEGTWGQAASASPMRIGVPASTSFFLLGVVLVLASGGEGLRKAAALLAFLPVAIASLSLVGYWFGASQLFGVAELTGIAWQTATIVAALGIGVVAGIREYGLMEMLLRPDAAGGVSRRLILPIIAIPFLLGWFRVMGEEAGMYDTNFGAAIRTLCEIFILLGFLWWTARSIAVHDAAARHASQALLLMEERFARFMDSLPGGAWIKDLDGQYVYANRVAATLLGREPAELRGRTDEELLPSSTVMVREAAPDSRESSGGTVVETFRKSDGQELSFLVTRFLIPGPMDAQELVGGIAIDITDRLRAEDELREAHRRKDEFLATLAHELRNPLAPIRFSTHLCRKSSSPEDLAWSMDVVERQVQQMTRLLDDLLDASRFSHGKMSLRLERVKLEALIHSAVEASQPLRDSILQSIDIRTPPHPVHLEADPVRLEQIFINLLNNAAKYGGRNSRVLLCVTTSEEEVRISIRDDGSGIPADRLNDIFEMFSQVKDPSNGPASGLGIGLSLVRGLVELHGGRVEAKSDGPGTGSEFIVHLPLSITAETEEEVAALAESALPALRLVVADDLRDSADSIAAYFRAGGHEVCVAYDGLEALEAVEKLQPDVVLLDVGMPKMNGHEVCRRIRAGESGKSMFIVALTGWGQASDRQLTKQAGFDDHLVKPVEVETLVAVLQMSLENRQPQPA